MYKDKIFASLLDKTAEIKSVATSYDNKYNRPENITVTNNYPCKLVRKANGYAVDTGASNNINMQLRCYLEIDAEVKTGNSITIDDEVYTAGLIYKPLNHHIEVDLINKKEG